MANIPKLIVLYNGVHFPFESVEEAAEKMLGFKIEPSEDETAWKVFVNGKALATSYKRFEHENDKNGYTYDEVFKDQMKTFVKKHTYSNLHWYFLSE